MTVLKSKNISLFLLALIVALLSFSPFKVKAEAYNNTYTNSETGYEAWVYDEAGLFSSSESDALLKKAYEITQHSDIYVITASSNSYGDSETATYNLCDEYYLYYCKNNSCVILMIDMATRYVYIYRNGSAKENLTESKCYSITDNVYTYLSDKEYYDGAYEALGQIFTVLEGKRIAEPMKNISNFFIALVVGFVITYLIAIHKSKTSNPGDAEMLKYAAIRFAANNPNDVVTGTTKTYCPRSSGSGGRGGGGGGHSGGGGGGHRF